MTSSIFLPANTAGWLALQQKTADFSKIAHGPPPAAALHYSRQMQRQVLCQFFSVYILQVALYTSQKLNPVGKCPRSFIVIKISKANTKITI